jgi:hypothetical protein
MTRLIRYMQWGLMAIVALMPFHAFLSVSLGHVFGHQAIIQSWKEVLLLILTVAAAVLIIKDRSRLARLRQPWVLASLALIALGLIVTAVSRPGLLIAAFGIKTDLEFLVGGIIATLVATKPFLGQLTKIVLISAAVVTGFDVLQIFVLPPDFLVAFGYGPSTILPYQHIAVGTSALRFPATLGGPNQLGTYLMLPLTLSTALFIRRRNYWYLALFSSSLISLIWTFSRSAWIGAAVAVIITIVAVLPAKLRRPAAIGSAIIAVAVLAALPFILSKGGPLQYFILHSSVASHDQANLSDSQHALSLANGFSSVTEAPLGHGLGTAGPTTLRLGNGNIIENYYLQIGYEMGLLAIAVFGFIVVALVLSLIREGTAVPLALPVAAAFIGISIVALVLPAWVDSTTALIAFIAAGAVTASRDV